MMGQELIEQIKTKENTDISAVNPDEVSSQITAQVTMALSTLDSKYKENVANYAQTLHECTHKIEMEKINLAEVYAEKEPHTNDLLGIEKEVDHGLRMLEHFTEQWIQKTLVVSELESEMKTLEPLPEQVRRFQYRHEEVKSLAEDIADCEVTLLQHELEKQNILLKIEPLDHKIAALQKKIRELESQKQYTESAYLHRITQIAPIER